MAHFSTILTPGKNWIRGIIGLAIGGIFIWLTLRQTSLEQVLAILSRANLAWIVTAMFIYTADLAVRVARWRSLLWDVKKLSFVAVGKALLVGYAMNNILPARLGELFRADFAGRHYQMSRSAIAGSIVVERVLDGLIVVLCLVLGRFFVREQAILTSLTTIGGMVFCSIFLMVWATNQRIPRNWSVKLPPAVANLMQGFKKGLAGVRSHRFTQTLYLSIIIWLLEGTAIWAILKAVDVSLSWQQMLSVVGVVSLSTLLPSAPGFLGTYQFAYAFIVSLFGFQQAQGVSAATAAQVFLLGSVTLVGLGLYFYLNFVKHEDRCES